VFDFNPFTIIFTIVNLLLLWWFLKHFLFEKITAILDKRSQTVQEDLDGAAQKNEQAGQLLSKYTEMLGDARQDSADLLAQAKAQAEKEYESVMATAHADANRLLDTARQQIETERETMLRETRKEVASLALLAAAKVAQKELDTNGDMALLDMFLSEAGDRS